MPAYKDIFRTASSELAGGRATACMAMLETFLNEHAATENIPARAMLLDLLARAQCASGQLGKGVATLQNAVDFLKASLPSMPRAGDSARLLAALLQNLSFALLEHGRMAEAEKAGMEAVGVARDLGPAAAPRLASALFGFSAVCYRQGKYDRAEDYTMQALNIWQSLADKNRMATCFNNLGRIYEERGQTDEGINWHAKAVDLRRHLPDELDLAFSLGNLGVALATAGRWREAEENLREAIACYARNGRSDTPECAGFASNLETCQKALGRHGH